MNSGSSYIIKIFFLWLISLYFALDLIAQDVRENSPILIISSYNPETSQTSSNISEFLDEYKALGGNSPVIIENMNCKSFSEALKWESQMQDILDKYQGRRSPSLIILLGQEAWTSYLSQKGEVLRTDIPILCGMVSRNAVLLPQDSVNLSTWMPESVDFEARFAEKFPIFGYVYD